MYWEGTPWPSQSERFELDSLGCGGFQG
ncbi:hypothetical protein P4O66_012709, partial [Electrophorus voltai]